MMDCSWSMNKKHDFPRVKVMQCKVFVLVCFAVFSPHYWTHLASHTAKHLLAACDSRKVICLHGSAEKQDGVEDIHEKNITNSQFISPQATNYHYRLVQIPRHPYLQHISQTTSSERHQLYFPRQLRKIQSKSAPSTRFLCCHCGEGQKVQRLRVFTRSVFVRNLICSDFFNAVHSGYLAYYKLRISICVQFNLLKWVGQQDIISAHT